MKYRIASLVVLSIFLCLDSINVMAEENIQSTQIEFTDQELETCVKNQLDIDTEFVSTADINELTELSCPNKNIESLEGLQYATNLQSLDLNDNQISNISELETLVNLRNLMLSNNNISNISILANLHNLMTIDLSDNQITSVNGLSGLSRLYSLDLSDNQITDVSPLVSLDYIKSINLSNNQISDISPLKNSLKNADSIDFSNQNVSLEDEYLFSNRMVRSSVTNLNGKPISVNLGIPKNGENELTGSWNDIGNVFSGTIHQNVTYQRQPLVGLERSSIKEGQPLTDQQLIEKYKVECKCTNTVSVDQSNVNYSKPGEYNIEFSIIDSLGNKVQIESELDVEDVLPTLEVSSSSVLIDLNSQENKILKQVNYRASEFVDDDLTANVIIDTSHVKFDTRGVYPVKFSVSDGDGNKAIKYVQVSVM